MYRRMLPCVFVLCVVAIRHKPIAIVTEYDATKDSESGGVVRENISMMIQSLRTFGGTIRDAPIYIGVTYSPQYLKVYSISLQSVEEQLRRWLNDSLGERMTHNVHIYTYTYHEDYLCKMKSRPNKILSLLNSRHQLYEWILLVDNDVVFLRDPMTYLGTHINLSADIVYAGVPEDCEMTTLRTIYDKVVTPILIEEHGRAPFHALKSIHTTEGYPCKEGAISAGMMLIPGAKAKIVGQMWLLQAEELCQNEDTKDLMRVDHVDLVAFFAFLQAHKPPFEYFPPGTQVTVDTLMGTRSTMGRPVVLHHHDDELPFVRNVVNNKTAYTQPEEIQ